MKIKDLEALISEAVRAVLSEDVDLRELTPKTAIRRLPRKDQKDRDLRSDLDTTRWEPQNSEIRITFEAGPSSSGRLREPATSLSRTQGGAALRDRSRGSDSSSPMRELLQSLDAAEARGYPFVALKYFRDTVLPRERSSWAESDQMRVLITPAPDQHFTLLTRSAVEFSSAVRRRQRQGDLEADAAQEMIARFIRHLATRYLQQPVTATVVETAPDLVERYPLRAYDALQLAGCAVFSRGLDRETPTFVSADVELMEAARLEGVPTFHPLD